MKIFILLLLLLLLFIGTAFAVDKKAEKLYTQEDFDKKVAAEVNLKVDQIKNKSVTVLTKEILAKEQSLKLREMELQKKEDQIKINSSEIEKKIQDFNKSQYSVLGCMQKNDEDLKARVIQQVEVVSSMKPDKAAQLLSVQDADIAVRILQLLDPKKASKIFNLMDKEVSARLQKQYMDMKR